MKYKQHTSTCNAWIRSKDSSTLFFAPPPPHNNIGLFEDEEMITIIQRFQDEPRHMCSIALACTGVWKRRARGALPEAAAMGSYYESNEDWINDVATEFEACSLGLHLDDQYREKLRIVWLHFRRQRALKIEKMKARPDEGASPPSILSTGP